MKVISQLIRHFWQSGSLSPDDVEYLLRHGFARQKDFPGYRKAKGLPPVEPCELNAPPAEPPSPLEHVEESLLRRGLPGRGAPSRRGRAATSAKEIKVEDICRHVRELFDRRAPHLPSLVQLAGSNPGDDWRDSLVGLHSLPTPRVEQLLVDVLKQRNDNIEALWHALNPEPFVLLANTPTWKGPACSAFSALVSCPDSASLGRYKWILKYPELCDVANVLYVWRQFLCAIGGVYRDERPLLTRALKTVRDPVVVWSFVLLYNATHLHDIDNRAGRPEYGPIDLPTHDVWQCAWNSALMMDSAAMPPYFAACYSVQSPEADPIETCQCPIMCPDGWRVPGPLRPHPMNGTNTSSATASTGVS